MLDKEMQSFLSKYAILTLDDLKSAIKKYKDKLSVEMVYRAAELLNPNRESTAAYYTDLDICKIIFDYLPVFDGQDSIRILEPSVGAGSFLPFIAEKYKTKKLLEITIIDIDENELEIAKLIFETYYREKYPNVAIRYWSDDYLLVTTSGAKYDLIIGNPPYDKLKGEHSKLKTYKKISSITKSSNLFIYFLEKAIKEAKWVSLIIPKSLLNAPEYVEMRYQLCKLKIDSIIDFGEYGFKGVKIETINIIINADKPPALVKVFSQPRKVTLVQEQGYITDESFPSWLLYRNEWFDKFVAQMEMDVFDAFRDRQIVNSMLSDNGQYRVLKSRNIGDNEIIDIAGYDTYCDNISDLPISKFVNQQNVVCVPNLSYFPRATFLPTNTITNGSVALLTLKDKNKIITENDLSFFATIDFCEYYRIARNFGTRSLNIDSNSVFFFGLKRKVNV